MSGARLSLILFVLAIVYLVLPWKRILDRSTVVGEQDGTGHCLQIAGAFVLASTAFLAIFNGKPVELKDLWIYIVSGVPLLAMLFWIIRCREGEAMVKMRFDQPTASLATLMFHFGAAIFLLLVVTACFQQGPFAATPEKDDFPAKILSYKAIPADGSERIDGYQLIYYLSPADMPSGQFPNRLGIRCHFLNQSYERLRILGSSSNVLLAGNDHWDVEFAWFEKEESLKAQMTADEYFTTPGRFLQPELNERVFKGEDNRFPPKFPPDPPMDGPRAQFPQPETFPVYVDRVPPMDPILVQFVFLPAKGRRAGTKPNFTEDDFRIELFEVGQ